MGSGLPHVAVITVVRDEATMLPRWVAHYAAQVGAARNLLVLDDNSRDGSTTGLPCPVVPLPNRRYDAWAPTRLRLLNGIAAGLLEVYDAVVFTDADEFLVADPAKYADLRELIADRPGTDVFAAQALNVVHHVGREPDLDPARPVLDQRRLAKFVPLMCKPSVKRVPAAWAAGSHGIRAEYQIDPDLYMFHLKFADRAHLAAAAAHRQALTQTDNRGQASSWAMGEELVDLLDRIAATADRAEPEEFQLGPRKRAGIVVQQDSLYRNRGAGQAKAMEEQPLVRIPERFRGCC